MSAAPAGRLAVFAAFSAAGAGACSLSAVAAVQSAARCGASVCWQAGGPPAVPLAARLARRSAAVVRGASALVLFAPGAGSLASAALAVAAGVPVFVFSSAGAPLAGVPGQAGAWVPGSFVGLSCWAWVGAQAALPGFGCA